VNEKNILVTKRRDKMYCLECEPKVELDKLELKSDSTETHLYQFYNCPNCEREYVCHSQSGDMIQENLELWWE
jgi:Zn finger protein HypA/HybF involved in hydrogenase expression